MAKTSQWETEKLPPLVGGKGACEILGIQKMTLNRWLQPGSGDQGPEGTHMIPPARIEAGPVWVKADVEKFGEQIGRRRAPAATG